MRLRQSLFSILSGNREVGLFTCSLRWSLRAFWIHSPHLISGCQGCDCDWCESSLPCPRSPSSDPDYPELQDLLREITNNTQQTLELWHLVSSDSSKGQKCGLREVKYMQQRTDERENSPLPPACMGCSVALCLAGYGWPFCVRLWKAEWLLFTLIASTFMIHIHKKNKWIMCSQDSEPGLVYIHYTTLRSNQWQVNHRPNICPLG